MRRIWAMLPALVASLALADPEAVPAAGDGIREMLRQRVEQLDEALITSVDGVPIATRRRLGALYEKRLFEPIWREQERREGLLAAVEDAATHGLKPTDYHATDLRRLLAEPGTGDPLLIAERDIIFSDALARLEHDLVFGKVNPFALDPHWNYGHGGEEGDRIASLESLLDAASLTAALSGAAPQGLLYGSLREALARYRAIADSGGWPSLPGGPTLERGMRDRRIPLLRERLAAEFGLPASEDPELFDGTLESVVRDFQSYYAIETDGAVGRETRATMNVPVVARIDQIRVNLERARWVLERPDRRYLVVNIAGFHAYLMEGSDVVWESRVVVGTPYRKTPVFRSRMTYLVLNPTWTIPPTILQEDIIPEVVADPASLERRRIDVVDADGRIVDPATIDWSGYAGGGFPYQLVQRPGPRNSLGRVKFVLPNEYYVYLHDTPTRDLFSRAGRSFSSGCIRLEKPLELAEILLGGRAGWDLQAIESVLQGGETRTVFLPEPLPVMLLYWTAGFGPAGRFGFYPDVYHRDAAVLRALEKEFEPPATVRRPARPAAAGLR